MIYGQHKKVGRIIIHPDPEKKRIHGPLAHVDDDERKRIQDVPFGLFKIEMKRLEKEIAAVMKTVKKNERSLGK